MIKFILILITLILGLLISPFLFLLNRHLKHNIISIWSKIILSILKIKISVNKNLKTLTSQQNFLIAANHVSWLDIVVINSQSHVSFIATDEIKKWPFINLLTFCADTIFVNRSSKTNLKKINDKVIKQLKMNSVCFFPEGKATDGNSLLPFKSNLFQAAIDSKKNIIPISISYFHNNKKTTIASYYDDINLLESFFSILKHNNIEIKLNILDVIKPDKNRKIISDNCYQLIKKSF